MNAMRAFMFTAGVLTLLSTAASADLPVGDYQIKCQTSRQASAAKLVVESGIDPSGGYATTVSATKHWSGLDGILIDAAILQISPQGTPGEFWLTGPGVDLVIEGNESVGRDSYPGFIQAKSILDGQKIDLLCSVKVQ